ncbi:adenylate/guanylate cyclase domain-containing protein [Pseudodesulfovibrio sp. zrk46]|uniref:adenylate/guanylate cyclase domain-containing protein n=1 Tax=Pseudodesulfovibrio sp. zrk46 TaxID=2725288 RepID=UPI001448B745|nr:adenylate/guanylate cyclase domain-containing protein [Pseudodesulfovibrio sp. zrk46]QJB55009.1 GAF domain-containing protein [Pseudodesulfovibrio sp. zrk46]
MADYHDYTPEILSQVFDHRLQQSDIRRILDGLSQTDRNIFLDKISETFEKFTALLEVSNRLADSLSLDVLFTRLVSLTTEALRADRGTIFLNDGNTNELFSRIAMGENMQEIRFPNHLGIAGTVFTKGEALLIPDAYADSRFNQDVDKKTGYRTRNILTAPIRNKFGKPVGVIQILNKLDGAFDESDLSMLEAMGAQASSALVKAQLYEEVERSRKEEKELFEVTRAISTEIHLVPLIQKIMSTTTTILEADRSTLFVNDPKTNELWALVAEGVGTKEIRFPNHLGIAGTVFTTGVTENIPDAYADPRFNQEIDKKTGYKTDTILCMPVLNKDGAPIGVIQSLNKAGGPFTAKDEARVMAFSAQAAIAIENARLFEDVLRMKNYNESILESMSSGLITFDDEMQVEKCNAVALKLLDEQEEALLGRPVAELFTGDAQWVADTVAKVMETGDPDMALDTEMALPKGEILAVNATTLPLINRKEEVVGTLLVFEDISGEKRLQGTLARYMTKEVADQLMEAGESELGGQMKPVTIFFSDIRSFTTISEALGAHETVTMLNEYFTDMVDILFDYGGILDKYIGDAIMAVFGAPFPTGHDADNALHASVEMMRALAEFNRRQAADNKQILDIGIGLNTAEVVVGNIGSEKRMDYTVIGDGVNLASRLEGANKQYGSNILISEGTLKELQDEYVVRPADLLRVKGKTEPVAIFEVLDHHTEESFPNREQSLKIFHKGYDAYHKADFPGALQLFEECHTLNERDRLAALYIERCRHFIESPPGDDWDGVWIMTSK